MNPSDAGIGDPYWYEWSVGLRYIISMLNPDSGITSVTMQSSASKGLDDVNVHYQDGTVLFIQVKHTRDNDTLSFGDLVAPDPPKSSLLKQLAIGWRGESQRNKLKGIELYTNRKASTRAASIRAKEAAKATYTRPALATFWQRLKAELSTKSKLADISLPAEWAEAWNEWKQQLNDLSEEESYAFLKSLAIIFGQPGLVLPRSVDGGKRPWIGPTG